jgi:hypothetical protein
MVKAVILIVFVGLVMIVFASMRFIINSANKFFHQAEIVEKMINNGENYVKVADAIRKLEALTFHQRTHERLYTLKKLYYMKYGMLITKQK